MPILRLLIDAAKAAIGGKQYEKAAGGIEKSSKSAGISVKKLIGILGGIATIRKTIKVWSEFELTMRTLKGVSGATEEQFRKLNETAREMGATTQFSAKEAGEGLLFLARAGFSAEEAISALPSTLDLAVTGMLDLGTAADIASNVLAQFGLGVNETERVIDTLTNTANSANTTVGQLAEAMKSAGPIAGALGQSVETTAAAIGILGNSGIQASLAGTNLRGVMAALLKTTDGAEATMRQMGLALDDVDPAKRGLPEIFKRFGDANLTAAQAVEIFGRRNAAAALILSKNNKALEELTMANEAAKGTTKELAAEMRDTLSGSLKGLNSAFEEMLLSAGDSGLLAVFRDTVDVVADVIRLFSGAEAQMLQMNLISIELGRQFSIVWLNIKNGLAVTVEFMEKILLGLEATWVIITSNLSDAWIVFTGGLGSVLRSSMAVVQGILNFTVNTFKRGINDIIKVIMQSGAATAILEKLGVSSQALADTYTATLTVNRTLSQEIGKAGKAAAEEQEKVNAAAEIAKKNNEQAIINIGNEANAIEERKKKREEEFEAQIKGINDAAEAAARGLGERSAEKDSPEAKEKEAAGGPTPDELKEAQDEIDAILTDTQARRLELLSSGLSIEEQMRQEAFDKKMEKEIERAELDKEFINSLHESAFESEEEKAKILEDINSKHLERLNKMEDEFHNERVKRDAKKFRMRLQGASQFLEAASILSEAFGSGSLANSKLFGVAQAAVSTSIGIARAMELGFPAAYPAMALAAATGAAQIATILGASKGSGTISAPPTGGGAAAQTASAPDSGGAGGEAPPRSEVDLRISGLQPGQLVTTEMVEAIFDKANELIDDDFSLGSIAVLR